MRHYQLITIGEATVDAFMSLYKTHPGARIDEETGDICFRHGEKIDVERYDFCIGGNATNVAVGLTRLGIRSTLCTEIGDDEFSLKIRNTLAQENIDRLFVFQTKNAPSNFSMIINFEEDRTLFVKNLEREHNFQLLDVTADYIYLTSLGREWKKPYRDVVQFAQNNGIKLAFNPGSLQLHEGQDVVHEVLKKTDILFVNKEEGQRILFGKVLANSPRSAHNPSYREHIKELLAKLKKTGPKQVVLTDGKHGSFALDEQNVYHFRGLTPGKIVERTGAGDAYTAGFLAATLHNLPVAKAMVWGSLNAMSVVGHIGAQAGLLNKEQMEERLKANK